MEIFGVISNTLKEESARNITSYWTVFLFNNIPAKAQREYNYTETTGHYNFCEIAAQKVQHLRKERTKKETWSWEGNLSFYHTGISTRPRPLQHRAMQPAQGRIRQYEEAELLAEEREHLRARRMVSDAVYSQWRYVYLWELLGVGTWPDFGYMTQKALLLIYSSVSEGHFSFNTILNRNYLVGENFELLMSLNTIVILKLYPGKSQLSVCGRIGEKSWFDKNCIEKISR